MTYQIDVNDPINVITATHTLTVPSGITLPVQLYSANGYHFIGGGYGMVAIEVKDLNEVYNPIACPACSLVIQYSNYNHAFMVGGDTLPTTGTILDR